MKAMKIPAAILAVILLAALADGFVLTRQCEDWSAHVEQIEHAAVQQDWDAARDALESLTGSWEKWQTYLHILIDHDEIDQTEELLSLCQLHMEEKDTATLRVTVSQLRCMFSLLAEIEQLNIKNVL